MRNYYYLLHINLEERSSFEGAFLWGDSEGEKAEVEEEEEEEERGEKEKEEEEFSFSPDFSARFLQVNFRDFFVVICAAGP